MDRSVSRLFSCDRCRSLVWICSSCDRGNRYCGESCREASRAESIRRSSQRYQDSALGRENHRRRQKEYRARQAAQAIDTVATVSESESTDDQPAGRSPSDSVDPTTVTHHGSAHEEAVVVVADGGRVDFSRKYDFRERSLSPCSMCGRVVSGRVRYTFFSGEDPG